MPDAPSAPSPDDLTRAGEIVRRHLPASPVTPAPQLGDGVVLKLDTLQPTGSFKVRGALVAVAGAVTDDHTRALVAASAGNHALAVAFACERLGGEATLVVPLTASPAKLDALAATSAHVIRHGRSYDEAEAYGVTLAAERGARYVSPYNDPVVIAGQATIVDELLAQVPDLSTVVVPCGGGGLLSGVCLTLAGRGVRVVGVEAERSHPMRAALEAGAIVPVAVGPTLADGLAGNMAPGSVTFDIVRRLQPDMLTVTEEEIAEAVVFLATRCGVVAEGSGAVGVAALRSGRLSPGPGATAVLLTGRNIAPALLADLVAAASGAHDHAAAG